MTVKFFFNLWINPVLLLLLLNCLVSVVTCQYINSFKGSVIFTLSFIKCLKNTLVIRKQKVHLIHSIALLLLFFLGGGHATCLMYISSFTRMEIKYLAVRVLSPKYCTTGEFTSLLHP